MATSTTTRRTANRRAGPATTTQAPAVPATQPAAQAPAEPATQLPSTFAASTTKPGANPQASQAAFAAYRLPASLVAKGATLCGGTLPAKLQPTAAPQGATVVLVPGKPFVARSAHNAAWAQAALACIAQAQAAGQAGATPAQLLAAGVGGHSIAAYVKRGWLLQRTVAATAA